MLSGQCPGRTVSVPLPCWEMGAVARRCASYRYDPIRCTVCACVVFTALLQRHPAGFRARGWAKSEWRGRRQWRGCVVLGHGAGGRGRGQWRGRACH
eukprot:gene10933-biopygen4687